MSLKMRGMALRREWGEEWQSMSCCTHAHKGSIFVGVPHLETLLVRLYFLMTESYSFLKPELYMTDFPAGVKACERGGAREGILIEKPGRGTKAPHDPLVFYVHNCLFTYLTRRKASGREGNWW